MPFRRKVFRIEEMRRASVRPQGPAIKASPAPQQAGDGCGSGLAPFGGSGVDGLRQLKDETDSIFRAINRTKQELAALHVNGLSGAENGRVRQELDAVIDGAEHAIQTILAATEEIDEAANTLSAVLRHEPNQALAQDIREHVVRIFEACNFHDLAGQRINKVLSTLTFIEDRIARMMEIWGGIDAFREHAAVARAERIQAAAPLVNGPKLEGDVGHASQADIDAMFG